MSTDRLFDRYLEGERPADYRTLSGIELPPFLADRPSGAGERPGEYPFTRGIHAEMYRKRLWTRRQQSGYGTPRESNERLHYLLRQGATGLNIDTDMATKLGADPDHPLFEGEIGRQGTSIATLEDMEQLFDGIPLDKVSSTLIVQPPASAPFLAMYLAVARRRGIPPSALIGTIMNCALTQLSGATLQANTHFFPIEFSVRVGLDVMEYCTRELRRWNIVNVNAYNMRETGINAVQEAAFALALALEYAERLVARGLPVDAFAQRMAFFTAAHLDLFEEVAKLRAMRRIWARLMRERLGATEDRSCWFRTAIQTAALPLTAQEPLMYALAAGFVKYWGPARAAECEPLRAYLDSGLPVGGGSDSPVTPYQPLLGLWSSVTRETQLAGVQGRAWAIPMADALRWYTRGSAYCAFEEAWKGTLEVGKLADLVALSVDPLQASPAEVRDAGVLLTVVGGRIVHDGRPSRSAVPRGEARGFAVPDDCPCVEPAG